MNPKRIAVKLFTTDPTAEVALEPFIPLFHRFIQQATVEGLLVDVADYAHVPQGPGIILVGHDVDYGMDLTDGQAGLLVLRKHLADLPLADALRDVLRKALVAVAAIEADGSAGVHFATDRVELRLVDRLAAPNSDEAFGKVEAELRCVADQLYGAGVTLKRVGAADSRQALGAVLEAREAPDRETLIERLGGRVAAATAPAPAAPAQSEWDISVEELRALREGGGDHVLVDVREPHEYEICHLGGTLIPLGSLAERMEELERDAHVVVHCKTGGRSAQAVARLREAGFANAWNVQGGILAWIERVDPTLTKY